MADSSTLERLDTDQRKTTQLQLTQDARDAARGMQQQWSDVSNNKYYPLIQWFTLIAGKKYIIEAGNGGVTVVRTTPLKTNYWPLVESHIYPIPHSSIMSMPGTPDFTEDKQRARALLRNQALDAAKLDTLPMWLFDKKKIKNKTQLRDWKAGKMIEGTDIDANSMIPITKPAIHQYVDTLMNEMSSNAEKALATPEIQQGILFNAQRSATEINQTSANVDTRYNLTASLFSIAEANAAYIWLDNYKRHYKDGIDKKTLRIVGPFGPKVQPLPKGSFDFTQDPDVKIESRAIAVAKKRDQRNAMVAYGQLLTSIQGSNLRYFGKKMGRLLFTKEETDRFLPPTLDEMIAEKENDSLSENTLKGVVIEPTDDHKTHLEIHGKAVDTKAKAAHIEAHKKAMMLQRTHPELFAGTAAPGLVPPANTITQPTPGVSNVPPVAPVSPPDALKQLLR